MRPCKVWAGGKSAQGYGICYVPVRKRVYAHRLEWVKHHGSIPDGLCVLHKCDNPPCYEITHLFLGTRAENSADMKAKGRSTFGEKNPAAKLTSSQVQDIRARISRGELKKVIADAYNVHPSCVSQIARGASWR